MIFVDTSFWVAYYNSRDPRHREAVELIHDAAGLVTTNHIRGETWTLLRRRTDHALAAKFLDRTERSSELRTVFVSERLDGRSNPAHAYGWAVVLALLLVATAARAPAVGDPSVPAVARSAVIACVVVFCLQALGALAAELRRD